MNRARTGGKCAPAKLELALLLRKRRRQLDLTQRQVAQRIKVSSSHVQNLETGERGPSVETINRLAKVLGLDAYELIFLANPTMRAMLRPASSAWERFRDNHKLQRFHKVTQDEMEMLSSVTSLGEVHAPHEFIYILIAVRQAIGR